MLRNPHGLLKRFAIKLPVELTKAGTNTISDQLQTRQVSADAVHMTYPSINVEVGQEVEYYVTLPSQPVSSGVRMRCQGRVVDRDSVQNSLQVSIEHYEFVSNGRH